MYGLSIDAGDFIPLMIFALPIIAVAGGITAGIVKTIGQQRLLEMAQRERLAAIERGVDPSKLPPMPAAALDNDPSSIYLTPYEHARRRSQGLLIGGIITLAVGIAVGVFLSLISTEEQNIWAVGLIPGAVGVALLICSWIVQPRDIDRGSPSRPS
jgi:hypothetical protein